MIRANESQIYNWGIKNDATLGGGTASPKADQTSASSDASDNSISNRNSEVNAQPDGVAANNTRAANTVNSDLPPKLVEASKKYGEQADTMLAAYKPGQDAEKFIKAYDHAWQKGKLGASSSEAMNGNGYLTLSQRKAAYKSGSDFRKGKRGSETRAQIAEFASRFGNGADIVRQAYKIGQDPKRFARAFENAWRMGRVGAPKSRLSTSSAISCLTPEQRQIAYDLGREEALKSGDRRSKIEEDYYADGKMAAYTSNDNDWSETKPKAVTKADRNSLKSYASERGVTLYQIKDFDGDAELLKLAIDTLGKITSELPLPGIKVTLNVSGRVEDNEFASTSNGNITINSAVLRDRAITENNIMRGAQFASKILEDIIVHEYGHIYASVYGNIGLEIAKKAYFNLYGKVMSDADMLGYLSTNISPYSIYFNKEKWKFKPYSSKRYTEIFSEIIAKNNSDPNEFTTEFFRQMKGR